MNTTKRLSLLIGSIYSCVFLMAGPVNMEKAQQNALEFFNQSVSSKDGLRRAPVLPQKLKLAHMVMTEKSLPAYYVFDKDDGGFVIVSGDDSAAPVLGYSDNGTFNAANLPEGMKALLNSYERQITYLSSKKKTKPRKINDNWNEISPMVRTHWGQGEPFNALCPIDPTTNDRSITGCVAVALGQLMYYYKWPEVGKGQESYRWKGQTLSANFSKVHFEWDKMKLEYTSHTSPDENHAVANLLYNCAIAAHADFSSESTSASYSSWILTNYFGYKDQIEWLSLDMTSIDDFEAVIYHELKNERPVLFDSFDSERNVGHAMIIDGFKDGYFHINFGWRGYSDGHFLLTAILTDDDSFTSGQSILYNIQPDREPHVENHLYPNSSYVLSEDGTELVKWKGSETEIDLKADAAFNEVRHIKSQAFSDNSTVVSVILPSKTEVIESNSFERCQELEKVFIPQSVNKILPVAFTQCPFLDQFVVSESSSSYKSKDGLLIDLNENVVVACAAGLSGHVVVPDGIVGVSKNVFSGRQISSIKLPKSLTTISEEAFMDCQLLTTFALPANITFVGTKAFKGCTGIRQVAVTASTPPQVEDGAFEDIDFESAFLCVPSECMHQYLTASSWKKFSTIIGMAQPQGKNLIVYMKDGTFDSYSLREKPLVRYENENLIIATSSSSREYRIDEIWKMQYFEESQELDEPYAVYNAGVLTFYNDKMKGTRTGEAFKLNENGNNPGWYGRHDITKVVFDASFASARPVTTYRWFSDMYDLTTLEGIQYLNTSRVTDMAYMFSECISLTSLDVSHFNTSQCKNMNGMFFHCGKLTSLDVSHFNTSKCTVVDDMFKYDYALELLSISSTMGNLGEFACYKVGRTFAPCTIIVPEGFIFGVDISEGYFEWKSGYFKIDATVFSVSSEQVTLRIGETGRVQLISGQGDYSISNSHPEMVNAVLEGEEIVLTAIDCGTDTIKVTDNKTRQIATIIAKVTMPTTVKVEPGSINFGIMTLGTTKSDYFTVYNTGEGTLTFHLDYSTLDGIFDILDGTHEYILEPGESKQFTIVCTIADDYEYYGGGVAIYVNSDAINDSRVMIHANVNVRHEKHIPADAIDLGLPSGTMWASYNIGATKPEEIGLKYAWGETQTKSVFSWSNYEHCDGSKDSCHDIGQDISGTSYDVAHERWGNGWQIPTYDQCNELLNCCNFEQTSLNGVKGCKVSGPNGNSIFVPATDDYAFDGVYWSATSYYSSKAYFMTLWGLGGEFSPNMVSYSRNDGRCVRPVLSADANTIRVAMFNFNELPPYSNISIFDASGRIVKREYVGRRPQALDLNSIGKGVFFVNINGVTYKIVKK